MDNGASFQNKIRSSLHADILYPGKRDSILGKLREYGLEPGRGGTAGLIMAPHGHWDHIGTLAAAAFKTAAARTVDRIVLIGPVHEKGEEGIFLSDSDFFEGPMGRLPVDSEYIDDLCSCSTAITTHDIPHLYEHSLEVLLPFVSYCFPHASIIPVLCGGNNAALAKALSRAFEIIFEEVLDSTLFILSGNFTEKTNIEVSGCKEDQYLENILNKDSNAIIDAMAAGTISACGALGSAGVLGCSLFKPWTARLLGRQSISLENAQVRYAAICFE